MPTSTLPKLKDFACRLMAHEAEDGGPALAHGSRTFRAFAKLRAPLVQLTGPSGFRSLLSRSLSLASVDVAWLHSLHVRSDGSLEGLDEMHVKLTTEELVLGEIALAVQFIKLLVIFIGPTLTLQILQDVWPRMDDLNF